MRRAVIVFCLLAGAVAPAAGAVPPAFPAPPDGAVVLSRQAGDDALAVGVAGRLVRVSVVGQDGVGVGGLLVRLGDRGAVACGPGCYEVRLPAPPRAVAISVRGAVNADWRVTLPAHPRDAARLVARAARAWRTLRSLTVVDRLATDARHSVVTTWRMTAPNRVRFDVRGLNSGVIIGARRWDRQRGGRWVRSRQDPPLRQPVPFWAAVRDAHVLGETATTWRVSFFDPRTPAWFELVLDKRTLHTLDLRMNTNAHFMHERYSRFDSTARVEPPA